MLIINIIALICSLFFLCIPLVPVFLHTCLTLLHITKTMDLPLRPILQYSVPV